MTIENFDRVFAPGSVAVFVAGTRPGSESDSSGRRPV
jgi:hypothetical protein